MKCHVPIPAGPSQRFLTALCSGILITAGFSGSATAAVLYEVDRLDDDISASACTGAANDCSLRGAITKANGDGVSTNISLPDGTCQLTVAGGEEDLNATGDLDIRAALIIQAAAGANPVIQQTVNDRLLEAHPNIGSLTFVGPITLMGGNSLTSSGGLIRANGSGSLTLENVTLVGGQASDHGGCLSFSAPLTPGALSLTNVTISGCTAGGNGGGLYAQLDDSSALFDRVLIENNVAEELGGGLEIFGSSTTVNIVESTIQDNVSEKPATGNGSGGGMIFFDSAALILRSTVALNRAGGATGAIGNGGGLTVWDSSVVLRNSTVSGNVVEGASCVGSAVMVHGDSSSSLLVQQSTIVGEPVSSLLWPALGVSSNSTVTFEAGIVEGGCQVFDSGAFASNGFNIERPIDGSGSTQCGLTNPSDVLTSSPFLRPLAGYGGPTSTHALQPGAPAIWLVPSTYCQTTDQRLASRGLLYCDAGSYESSGEPSGMWIFSDGFESGDLAAWSASVP